LVHWGRDGWQDTADVATVDSGIGFHVAALDVWRLMPGVEVDFTWQWRDSGEWCHHDYAVVVEAGRL
jgi:glucoamylase